MYEDSDIQNMFEFIWGGPDLHIMTVAATGLSERFLHIKTALCVLVVLIDNLTAARALVLHNTNFPGERPIALQTVDADAAERESRIAGDAVENFCKLVERIYRKPAFRDTASPSDKICMRKLSYECFAFEVPRAEMPPYYRHV